MKNSLSHFLGLLFFLLSAPNDTFAQNSGDLDTSFAMGTFNNTVSVIGSQPDGRILVGGLFTRFKTYAASHLVRLNADNTFDNSFTVEFGGTFASVSAIKVQSDGKIIAGGNFTTCNGTPVGRLVRLNSDGSIDNTFQIGSGSNNSIGAICLQADGKIIVGGYFSSFNGTTVNKIVRLNSDGSLDNSFYALGLAAAANVYSIALQSDGKLIVVGSLFGIIRLNQDGSLDNTFPVGSGASSPNVYAVSVLPDDKIIVGGGFTTFNSVAKKNIAKLNADGSLDNTFNIGTGADDVVTSLFVQPDGKVLIGGIFMYFNGTKVNHLTRLNTDGSLDNTFDESRPTAIGYVGTNIASIFVKPNGKILIGGAFYRYNGLGTSNFAEINEDGTISYSYLNPPAGMDNIVCAIAAYPHDKILVGGYYLADNTKTILRLYSDGRIDSTFNPTPVSGVVFAISVQPDGKILVGGIRVVTGNTCLARLNADGTIDNTFLLPSSGETIYAIALQADGKILIGGDFTTYNGTPKNRLVRLNVNGTIDNTFNIGTGINQNEITAITIQSDGKVLVGGNFTTYNGVARNSLIRLNADGSLDNSFVTGSGITLSGGSSAVVKSITVQDDNKILIGGNFERYNGLPKYDIVRLNPDGTNDVSFRSGTGFSLGSASVSNCHIQPDNKIILTGYFGIYNGDTLSSIERLNPDGTKDPSFNSGTGPVLGAGATKADLYSSYLQKDGDVLIGGHFDAYKGQACVFLARVKGTPFYFNTIRGNIYTDNNHDCIRQLSEENLSSIVVKAEPGPYYGGTDRYGNYQIKVDTGTATYTVTQEYNSINNKLLINQCVPSHTVALTGAFKDTSGFNFADSVRSCVLDISVENARMRRCFRHYTYVNYCNYGNVDATGTKVKVEYPPYIVPIGSTPMWTSRQGSVLIYDLGTVGSEFCDRITIIDSVICGDESIRGLTQCTKASISADSKCYADDPNWDKSFIDVSGICINDTTRFAIRNMGSGNMSGNREYRVYVNDTLIYKSTYVLQSGQGFKVDYPSNGQTIRLEADQHALHPGMSKPRAVVENCGIPSVGNAPQGLVTTAPQDDLDEQVAIACNMIRDSYDPNDKQASPTGLGVSKQIMPGDELEYTIRFQNTGTDTAYTVRVVDTIDIALDPSSFIQGSSSHPYTLKISGKTKAVVTFTFNNINLPDSITNKIGSNGLVTFRLKVPTGTPLGTTIKNHADIYFDYNSPIPTNEVVHTVGITVVEDLNKGTAVKVGNTMQKPSVILATPSSVCFPNTLNLTSSSITQGSTPNLTYRYYSDATASIEVTSPDKVTSGTYYIVGLNEANLSDTAAVEAQVNPKPEVLITNPAPVISPATVNLTSSAITTGSTSLLNYSYYENASATVPLMNPNAISASGNYYIVGTKTGLGCSDTSLVEVTINPVTSITEGINSLVKIFPNPSSGLVILDMGQGGNDRVLRIYSSIGCLQKEIKLENSSIQQVSLESIGKGVYIFEILQNSKRLHYGMLEMY